MTQPKKTPGKDMPFFDHIDELRVRLLRCLYVFVVGFGLCFWGANQFVMEFLRAPLFEILPLEKQNLYFTSLFENFLTHIKIASVSSAFLLSPYFFYQVWAFIAPGLYPKERKFVVPFVLLATVCFVGGALFAYYVLFPVAFKYFISFGFATDVPLLTINSYYGTCLKMLLLFGLAFELPVLVILLGYLGVIDSVFLRKHRQNAIIGITVLCAVFAPPDAISMIILMIPLVVLYEMSIWVVQWIGKSRERERALAPASEVESTTPTSPTE